MLLWCWLKTFQRPFHLESGVANGSQKNNISFDLLQNMMIRGVGPKASERYPTELPLKTFFSLLITHCCPRWRRSMAGWLACWLAGLAGLAGFAGFAGCAGCAGFAGLAGLARLAVFMKEYFDSDHMYICGFLQIRGD